MELGFLLGHKTDWARAREDRRHTQPALPVESERVVSTAPLCCCMLAASAASAASAAHKLEGRTFFFFFWIARMISLLRAGSETPREESRMGSG